MRRVAIGLSLSLSLGLGPSRTVFALPRGELKLPGRKKIKPVPGEPGSGVGLDRQLRPPNAQQLQAPLPRRPRSDKEAKALDDLEGMFARYRDAHDAMAHTVGQMLIVDGERQRRALEQGYQAQIRKHQAQARKMRARAVRRYDDFLKIHPDDPTWTPEIMFRLAELHFDTSADRLARQEEAFDKELVAYEKAVEKDPNASAPVSPKADYRESIALYRGAVTRFPQFHLGDASLYMMGTLLYEMEELDQSRQSYLALACASDYEPPLADGTNLSGDGMFTKGHYKACKPYKEDSKFVAEAWLRIGEVHYDLDDLDPALEAYAQAAKDPDGDLYDEALIRMAWTLYLMREFETAAKRLDEFILYADARRTANDKSGALTLRDDAVKYLAKAYLEDDWDGDGRRDRIRGFERLDRDYRERGKERHVPETYAALGDLFADVTEYGRAIRIWETTLARWPLAPAAPMIQMRILQAHNMLQDKQNATLARDRLATNYLRGTRWFYANENDPDVVEAALKLAEEALVHTATDHHLTAQSLRAAGDPKAKEEYQIAARAYEAYLERFPDTPSSYEYRYNFAESLYYSDQYLKAAKQYQMVRDSNLNNTLQEDAADGTVLAYEAYIAQEESGGRFEKPPVPQQGAAGPFDKPKEMPELMRELQAAYDRFVELRPDADQAPTMKFLAGEVSARYHHFDDAQVRFEEVLERHCDQNVAINAGKAIVDGYIVRKELKLARQWTEKLLKQSCGSGEEKEKFAGDLKTIGNAVRFQEAELLYEAGEYEAAADRYVALVDAAPDDKHADRALNNAAVAYENIGRFSSASQTYRRIYTKYPDSEFADKALLRTGFNHSRFFEFDKAVASYLILAQDARYSDSEHRELALWNAADLLDNLQDYKRSAKMYQEFAAKSEDKAKAADALFRAAEVMSKTRDHKGTIRAYEKFVSTYGSDPAQADKAVESQLRIGQAYAALGKRSRAEAYYRATVTAFETKGLKAATEAADFPSEAQFLLAEFALQDVLKSRVKASHGKKMEREFKQLTDRLKIASDAYANVFNYRRIDWVLAAMHRRGYAFETWAINTRAIPVPRRFAQYSEAWFAYKDIVDRNVIAAEAQAIKMYEMTVAKAKEFNVGNAWTRAARERLNIYKPEQYPLLRAPALDMQLEDMR